MTGSVILYVSLSFHSSVFSIDHIQLYTISAGFKLRTPLPPYLPPAELNRQRLVAAIRELDVVKKRSARGGNKHLLYFAYALAMQVCERICARLTGYRKLLLNWDISGK